MNIVWGVTMGYSGDEPPKPKLRNGKEPSFIVCLCCKKRKVLPPGLAATQKFCSHTCKNRYNTKLKTDR